nr:ATP-binding protein [Nocardioides sp. URHA0032]
MSPYGSGFWAGELDGLVGRDPVLVAVRDLLAAGDRTVVLTGLPGSGKTSVLTVAARALAADGWLVLRMTGYESDRDLAFGVLVDLLASAPDAEEVLDHVVPDPDRATVVDPLRLRLDVLAWLEQVSESRPVVLVADDLQWCDDSTLSVLGFVANRLAGSDISVLAATRADVPPAPLRHHTHLALPGLTDRDARVLLRRAGFASPPAWVIERAAGNPLALLELGRAASDGAGETAPSSVETAFREQVAELPAATRSALLLAATGVGDLAVLGRTTDPAELVAALAPAEAAGLVTVVDHVVTFRHPLVAAAVGGLATTTDRMAAHAALAAAYEDDVERAAWHRAEATVVPDEDVARALVTASSLATRRGASAEAGRLMARASELSPDRSDREERLLWALQISVNAGSFDWVVEAGGRLELEAEDVSVQARAAQSAAYALAQTDRSSAARRACSSSTLAGLVASTSAGTLTYSAAAPSRTNGIRP